MKFEDVYLKASHEQKVDQDQTIVHKPVRYHNFSKKFQNNPVNIIHPYCLAQISFFQNTTDEPIRFIVIFYYLTVVIPWRHEQDKF